MARGARRRSGGGEATRIGALDARGRVGGGGVGLEVHGGSVWVLTGGELERRRREPARNPVARCFNLGGGERNRDAAKGHGCAGSRRRGWWCERWIGGKDQRRLGVCPSSVAMAAGARVRMGETELGE